MGYVKVTNPSEESWAISWDYQYELKPGQTQEFPENVAEALIRKSGGAVKLVTEQPQPEKSAEFEEPETKKATARKVK